MQSRPRLLRITTVPISLKILLNGQLSYFQRLGFEVLAVSADGPEVEVIRAEGIAHQIIPMTRKITPIQDLVCVFKLIQLIRRFRPDIIHTHTPKAGLLGMLAGWLCRVPIRMHTVAGLPLMETKGLLRTLLLFIERVTYACATAVYPNSFGLRDFIIRHIGFSSKISIIGSGSSNGIDTAFFNPSPAILNEAQDIRLRHNVTSHQTVFCFVGRVVNDKGIREMVSAFKGLRETQPDIRLLLVGPLEQELDPLSTEDLEFLQRDSGVIMAGYQKDVRPWLCAADIFVFPSYREGFPNVVMQASCMGKPCIVSDINGCNEIIQHGRTGFIVPVKNALALQEAMHQLSINVQLQAQFARDARAYIVDNFDQQFVWDELHQEYKSKLTSLA